MYKQTYRVALTITNILFIINSLFIPTAVLAMTNQPVQASQTDPPSSTNNFPVSEVDLVGKVTNVSSNQRHPYAGVYPVWAPSIEAEDLNGKYPFLKGHHLFVTWEKLKPVENGPYKWHLLDNKAKIRLGNTTNKVL